MLTRMSDSSEHRAHVPARVPVSAGETGAGPDGADTGSSVLAGLPRTRPQRASARRVASRSARSNAAVKVPAAPKREAKKRTQTKRRTRAKESVPRQGYEAEPESLNGPVHPPGGTELVASAAELAGELARTGVNTGVRVLRDFLSRLPG
jgi:hypothetical protein